MALDLLSEETDVNIRAVLRDADDKGKLSVVAAVTGIGGGETELRRMSPIEVPPLHRHLN